MNRSSALIGACLVVMGSVVASPGDEPTPDEAMPAVEAAARLRLPDGFRASLFAGEPDVEQPIAFTIDPRGRLWVAECYSYPDWSRDGTGRDRILIFEDTDGDGRHDKRTVFWDKGANLSGLEVGFGGVWVCATPNFLFIPDRDGDDVPDGEPEVLLDGWSLDAQHNVFNGLTWGPDGWLYGANGILATSKVGPPGTPDDQRVAMNCGVWRFHPTDRKFEVVAHGTTNPWGLDFDAEGELFITNCVIPHLFHVVPGAHYERMYGQDLNSNIYELIQTCADHVHWDTREVWSDIRRLGVTPTTDRAGGGHAHVGAMIYLGDNWPVEFRGDVFTCNVHGHRVNRDSFKPFRSTVVASHRPDFLLSPDSWFRGLELQYGPDGGVYVTDWSDIGECHEQDADGAHRENGRIFKVTFGTPDPVKLDLTNASDAELVRLQTHENEWYSRTARRLLQERAAVGRDLSEASESLRALLSESREDRLRLRALWALSSIGGISEAELRGLLDHERDVIRRWAVRLLVDRRTPAQATLDRFTLLAREDASPRVRLALASALQSIPDVARRPIAEALAGRPEDSEDPMIPLMVWYGVEPLLPGDLALSARLASKAELPTIRRFAARRAVEANAKQGLSALLPGAAEAGESAARVDVLDGVLAGLRGRRSVEPPANWEEVRPRLLADAEPAFRDRALVLGLKFGDAGALGTLRLAMLDPETKRERRRMALDALVMARSEGIVQDLRSLVGQGELSGPAIRALAAFDDEETIGTLLRHYADLSATDRADAVASLAARPRSARALLDAIGSGVIDRRELPVSIARQILEFGDADLSRTLEAVWGTARPTSAAKAELLAQYKAMLTPESLRAASPVRGRDVFAKTCASCHTLFGEGGVVGPELTGSDRRNVDYVLENVLDPSASVGRDYTLVVAATIDGRLISGIVREQDERAVVLQTPNERVVLPRDEIEALKNSNESMMPEGLLQGLGAAEIRDLIAYLASDGDSPPSEK